MNLIHKVTGDSHYYEFKTEDDLSASRMSVGTRISHLCGSELKSCTIGGVGTRPEFRREGYVRQMLNAVHQSAPENGWAVSFLHPFSFAYYRKFGYEKVADEKILTFPLSKLDFLDRWPDLVPVNSEQRAADCTAVYNAFAKNRGIMFKRFGTGPFPTGSEGRPTYLRYDREGNPIAYISYDTDRYFDVNKMVSVALHVREFAFTTPEGLRDILGFLRMFDGEDSTIIIHNCAMAPEVDLVLPHYMQTADELRPDIMARILDVPAVLAAHSYPDREGSFTLRVADTLDFTRGSYRVDFGGGEAKVTRISETLPCDLDLDITALARLIYGYEEYTPALTAYMPGVTLNNPKSSLFEAFHKQPAGLFEHF